MASKTSIIIPVYNKWDLTKDCLASLARHILFAKKEDSIRR